VGGVKDCATPHLPGVCWTEGTHIVAKNGTRLQRWGSVKKACAILDECDRQVIYDLHASGDITAYKLNPKKRNSHLKVDLLSVWEHKQKQLRRA
jgi:hypothetical protein